MSQRYNLLEEIWFTGSSLNQVISNCRCSLCSGSRSCRMHFAITHFTPRSCIKISDTVVFGVPRSAPSSHTVGRRSWLIAVCTRSTFSGVLLVTGLPEMGHFQQFWTIFEAFVPHFYLCCSHCIFPESLRNRLNSFHGGMFKLNTKFDADSLLYSLSHFECDGHTVHMLTQQHLPPPLTSTVKSSLFTHAHSSPLSLAARLHR